MGNVVPRFRVITKYVDLMSNLLCLSSLLVVCKSTKFWLTQRCYSVNLCHNFHSLNRNDHTAMAETVAMHQEKMGYEMATAAQEVRGNLRKKK